MPELPEAESIARALQKHLPGAVIGEVVVLRPDVVHGDPAPLTKLLSGRRVQCVRRQAKRVVCDLTPAGELIFHLGMSGRLTLLPPAADVEPHTHVRIAFPELGRELRFRDPRRFGGVWCLTGQGEPVGRRLGEVGLEPLSAKPAEFLRAIHRRRQIKALLMDQHLIAGLGNIYCDESLHAARIHPGRRGDDLSGEEARRLFRSIRSTLQRTIRFNGSTFMDYRGADGSAGGFQKFHRVYQKAGLPCRRCDAPIHRIIVNGRSTFFCANCQENVETSQSRRAGIETKKRRTSNQKTR